MAHRVNSGGRFDPLRIVSEAVLRAVSVKALLQDVCDAAARKGVIKGASAFLVHSDDTLAFAAGAGEGLERLRPLCFAGAPQPTRTPSAIVEVVKTGLSFFTPASQDSPRARRLAKDAQRYGAGAIAPISGQCGCVGALVFCPQPGTSFDSKALVLIERIAAIVSAGMERLAHEAAQKADLERAERQERRFALLKATNDAVLRSRNPEEMFQMVCDAAAGPAGLLGASIVLHSQRSQGTPRIAYAGKIQTLLDEIAEINPASPDGVVAEAVLRTGEPYFAADAPNDPRFRSLRTELIAAGVEAVGVLPLAKRGLVVGAASFFHGGDGGALDEEHIGLIRRIADNLSFGLEMFERQDQKRNLAGMFAALSATNEAIMRAQTRAELLRLRLRRRGAWRTLRRHHHRACGAGKRFSAHRRDWPDPTAAMSRDLKLAINEDRPEGRGLTGTAFRTAPALHQQRLSRRRKRRRIFVGRRARPPRKVRRRIPADLSSGVSIGV